VLLSTAVSVTVFAKSGDENSSNAIGASPLIGGWSRSLAAMFLIKLPVEG
jgi:hypothetical protein